MWHLWKGMSLTPPACRSGYRKSDLQRPHAHWFLFCFALLSTTLFTALEYIDTGALVEGTFWPRSVQAESRVTGDSRLAEAVCHSNSARLFRRAIYPCTFRSMVWHHRYWIIFTVCAGTRCCVVWKYTAGGWCVWIDNDVKRLIQVWFRSQMHAAAHTQPEPTADLVRVIVM